MKIIIKTKGGTGFSIKSPEDVLLVKGHLVVTEEKSHYAIPVSNIDFIADKTGVKKDLIDLINFMTKTEEQIKTENLEEKTNETTDGKDKTS
jgi:hypothetical protein